MLWLGVVMSLMLPPLALADHEEIDDKFDKNGDGIFDSRDWQRLKAHEKKTYARMLLEKVGENPSTLVSKGRTREALLLEGLEGIYGK